MRKTRFIVPLVGAVALLTAAELPAQTEGRPCIAEPTDELIAYGNLITCSIEAVGDSDLFRFVASAGEMVHVQVTDHANILFFHGVALELRSPSGTVLASAGNFQAATIQLQVPDSGVFTIRVNESGNDQTTSYTVVLDQLAPPPPTAVTLNPGDRVINASLGPVGDADMFVFRGVSGDLIRLQVADRGNPSFSEGVTIKLFRPDGSLLRSASNFAAAGLEETLQQSGDFVVRVTEAENDQTRSYNLEYLCLIGSCPSFHRLTVGRNGGGNVSSSPAVGSIWQDCSERYFEGIVVTLTPTANPSWVFSGWSGDPDCSDGVVTITSDSSCMATFVPAPLFELFDDDGKPDFAVWRASTGVWYVIRSSDGSIRSRQWGAGYAPYNDVAVPADYDGDGKTDIAVWRRSTGDWFIVRSSDGGIQTRQWGAGYAPYNDVAVPADYDGDGKADMAVWRASTGDWFVVKSPMTAFKPGSGVPGTRHTTMWQCRRITMATVSPTSPCGALPRATGSS